MITGRNILVRAALLAFQTACGRDVTPRETAAIRTASSEPAVPTGNRANQDSLLVAFERVVLQLGHTRDSLERSLGRPRSITVEEAENADGGRDSLITLRYPNIEFFLRKPLADGREYFSNVIVDKPWLALPGSITLQRTTRGELTRLLGEPHRVIQFGDSAAFTYDVPRGPIVQFYFVDDVLRKIRWVYELG
jgi:hypothetical protein